MTKRAFFRNEGSAQLWVGAKGALPGAGSGSDRWPNRAKYASSMFLILISMAIPSLAKSGHPTFKPMDEFLFEPISEERFIRAQSDAASGPIQIVFKNVGGYFGNKELTEVFVRMTATHCICNSIPVSITKDQPSFLNRLLNRHTHTITCEVPQ